MLRKVNRVKSLGGLMRKRKICEAVLSALLAFLLACPTPVLAQVALGVSGTQAQENASQPEDASNAQETDSTEKVSSEETQVEDKQASQGSAAAETNAEANDVKKDGTELYLKIHLRPTLCHPPLQTIPMRNKRLLRQRGAQLLLTELR